MASFVHLEHVDILKRMKIIRMILEEKSFEALQLASMGEKKVYEHKWWTIPQNKQLPLISNMWILLQCIQHVMLVAYMVSFMFFSAGAGVLS